MIVSANSNTVVHTNRPTIPHANIEYRVPVRLPNRICTHFIGIHVSDSVARYCQQTETKIDFASAMVIPSSGGAHFLRATDLERASNVTLGDTRAPWCFDVVRKGNCAKGVSLGSNITIVFDSAAEESRHFLAVWDYALPFAVVIDGCDWAPTKHRSRSAWTLCERMSWQTPQWVRDYSSVASRAIEIITAQSRTQMDVLYAYNMTVPKGGIPTLAQLKTILADFAADASMAHEYILDGCYARAHILASILRAAHFNVEKLFVQGNLKAKNRHMGVITWTFHVAPLVVAYNEHEQPQLYVLDVSQNATDPLFPGQWIDLINKGSRVKIELTHSRQYLSPSITGEWSRKFATHLSAAHATCRTYRELLTQSPDSAEV